MAANDCKLENLKVSGKNIAHGTSFSIAVPDGWIVHTDVDDESTPQGLFVAAPSSVPDEDVCESVRIMYRKGPSSDETSDFEHMYFTPVFRWAVITSTVFNLDKYSDNPLAALFLRSTVWDTEVDFSNGTCFVNQLECNFSECGLEFYIRPYDAGSSDSVCCVFTADNEKDVERARKLVSDIARTIKLDKPLTAGCEQQLINATKHRVSAQTFAEVAAALAAVRPMTKTMYETFTHKYAMLHQGEKIDEHKALIFAAKGLAEFNVKMVPYFNQLMDAYISQSKFDTAPDELAKMLGTLRDFQENLFITPAVFEDQDISRRVRRSGALDDFEELKAAKQRLKQLIDEEVATGVPYDSNACGNDAASNREDAGESSGAAEAGAFEVAATDAPPCERMTYEAWWEPFPDNREPYYGGYNNRFDHTAACWLLYADRVFFNDNNITWDGKHHAIKGAQINATYMSQIPVFIERRDNYMPAFVELLYEIESDEGLIIPRSLIHPVVQKALPEGDLTGVTLMNLQACAKAVMITQKAADQYVVVADARVRSGIPDFTNLVGRLIWDLRNFNGVKAPFSVMVAGSRNIDANIFFGDNLNLNKPVAGASGEGVARFTQKPQVHLPSKEEVEKVSRPFASGMDHEGATCSPAPGVEAAASISTEMENDEELFELELYKLAESFPLTIPIEGTGYLGRVERIEDVKVGDPLVLASDWQSKHFSPCCIEVFNDRGETLGNLQEWRQSITNSGNRELALLLPYVTATVESVTPKSKRRKNAKYALMDVRLTLNEPILSKTAQACKPEVLEKAKETLRLSKAQRITMSKSPLTCFDLKGNIDPRQMPKIENQDAAKKENVANKKRSKSRNATAESKKKRRGKTNKVVKDAGKAATAITEQESKTCSVKDSNGAKKQQSSGKKLTPLQRAERAHEIIVKEHEELMRNHLSRCDDEAELLACRKLLECGGGLTEHDLITELWDELQVILKKRNPGSPMDYEAGHMMLGIFLETYSSPLPSGRSYSLLTHERRFWTDYQEHYYLTPQTDAEGNPMPDYYAQYLELDKQLNSYNNRSTEARKRKASIPLLEKEIVELKHELKSYSLFDFKARRAVKNKIADAQKRIDDNRRFVEKVDSDAKQYFECQEKLDKVKKEIEENAARFRDTPIQRTGLPRGGAWKREH